MTPSFYLSRGVRYGHASLLALRESLPERAGSPRLTKSTRPSAAREPVVMAGSQFAFRRSREPHFAARPAGLGRRDLFGGGAA